MFPPLRLREALSPRPLSPRELAIRTWHKPSTTTRSRLRAAGVAFYAMLALVPFLGLVLTLSIQLLPDLTGSSARARGFGDLTVVQFRATLNQTLPPEAAKEIEEQIRRIQAEPPVGLISIGLAITLWLASSLFVAVIDAMNRIYGVRERRGFVKIRLVAILMTVIQAAILVGSLVLIVALAVNRPQEARPGRLGRDPRDDRPVRRGRGHGVAELRPVLLRRARRRAEPMGMDHARQPVREPVIPRRRRSASGSMSITSPTTTGPMALSAA